MARDLEMMDPKDIVIIGLDTDDGPEHPLYDERVMLEPKEEMVKNILAYGVQQPVHIRKDGGQVFCVEGRQRVKAARIAAQRLVEVGEYALRVPVIEARGTDARLQGLMISANEIRFGDDVLTRAAKAQRLLARIGDIDEVCVAFGKSITTVKNWLSLNEADPAVHDAIRNKLISSYTGLELAKKPRAEQKEALELITRGKEQRISLAKAKVMLDDDEEEEEEEEESEEGGAGTEDGEGIDGLPPEVEVEGDGSEGNEGEIEGNEEEQKKPEKKKKTTKKKKTAKKKPSTDRTAVQRGVKRSWLRKALKSETGRQLSESEPDNFAVLQWFAWGDQPVGTWFDRFAEAASDEIGQD